MKYATFLTCSGEEIAVALPVGNWLEYFWPNAVITFTCGLVDTSLIPVLSPSTSSCVVWKGRHSLEKHRVPNES